MTKIYEAKNHLLIHTGYANPVEHRHMAAHIIVSPSDSIRVISGKTEYICQGVMIPSGISHKVDTNGKPVLVFLYDCTTDVAKQMKTFQFITKASCDKINDLYFEFEQNPASDRYCKFEQSVLKVLGITKAMSHVTDERIAETIKFIRANASEKIMCQEVADIVHLSQGRFSHLFRKQVGMTFASYLIYQRIMYVYAAILQGKSITEAALDAGFSSSAHFADVNRRVFGLSASDITQDLVFIKI